MKNVISVMMVVLLVGCGATNKVTNKMEDSIYKKWELSSLDGKQVRENQPLYLELTKDKKVSGFVGCNRVTGSFEIKNKTQIRFTQLATTRMMCSQSEMELERKLIELLNSVDNFNLENRKLMLQIGKKAPQVIFDEMDSCKIVNKYWKLIKLNGSDVKMLDNQEKEQHFILRSDSTISGFTGCNSFNGQYEHADGNKLKFKSNMAMTMRMCPELSIDESAFLKVFELAENYTLNGDTLSLLNGENAVLAVFEAVYF